MGTTSNSAPLPCELVGKLQALETLLDSYGTVAVGFSGGVDSTFLAEVCARRMPDRTLLVHLTTPFIGTPEQRSFTEYAEASQLPVLELEVDPLASDVVAANPPDRCYHCKHLGFERIVSEARARGFATVIEGSNADDAGDYRPGMRAVKELGVCSPLMETNWHKAEEREVLRAWGVPVWSLPAGACLATRIPCGEPLDASKLRTVRACEDYLLGLGLKQVRVRLVGNCAHVEAAPEDLMLLDALGGIVRFTSELQARGAGHVSPQATAYQHGAMTHLGTVPK